MTADDRIYTCPMHPEVRQRGPGNCPKCGMTLEPVVAARPRTEWTCPMHPQIVRDAPGSCPICGMALEPQTVGAGEGPDPELVDMTRRFWIGLVLTLPLLAFVMGDMLPGQPLRHLIPGRFSAWLQLVLATPVVLWAGWPFFQRGWASVVNRSLNMFTLIALGTGMAYVYSVVGALAPRLFPASFRTHGGEVGLYFEAAAGITGAPDGTPAPARRHRGGRAARACTGRRPATRAAWRESPGRRRGARRTERGGRIDGDRRVDARGEDSR